LAREQTPSSVAVLGNLSNIYQHLSSEMVRTRGQSSKGQNLLDGCGVGPEELIAYGSTGLDNGVAFE